jgi:SAM-dependent methyltransferase
VRSPAELYDWEIAHVNGRDQNDLAFYLALAEVTGGPVLELACGTGRIAAPLVEAGFEVVGLDIDREMLIWARRRGVRRLVQADMARFTLAARFGLVAVPYNSLQLLLTTEAMTACLRAAAAHLRSDGLLALEVTDFQAEAVRTRVDAEEVASADGVVLEGSLVHDLARRRTTYQRRFRSDGWSWEDHVRLRCLDRDELGLLLTAAGLSLVRAVEDSGHLFAVARRPAA